MVMLTTGVGVDVSTGGVAVVLKDGVAFCRTVMVGGVNTFWWEVSRRRVRTVLGLLCRDREAETVIFGCCEVDGLTGDDCTLLGLSEVLSWVSVVDCRIA